MSSFRGQIILLARNLSGATYEEFLIAIDPGLDPEGHLMARYT